MSFTSNGLLARVVTPGGDGFASNGLLGPPSSSLLISANTRDKSAGPTPKIGQVESQEHFHLLIFNVLDIWQVDNGFLEEVGPSEFLDGSSFASNGLLGPLSSTSLLIPVNASASPETSQVEGRRGSISGSSTV
jgi:hypothetical protein